MDGFKEFLESSTIHGLVYIASNRRVARLLWICIVITAFTGALVLIQQSFSSWKESPVSTTIETRSISDLAFPGVVVCPARNSFTSLNPALTRAEKNSLDQNTTQRLLDIILEATFDLNVENKYKATTSFFEKDKFFNWYNGQSKLLFPSRKNSTQLNFFPKTYAVSGRISTAYFEEIFYEEDFELELDFSISIYVPKKIRKTRSISLVIDIDYDIDEHNDFYGYAVIKTIYGSNTDYLNSTEKKYKKEFPLEGNEYYKVVFYRNMYNFKSWKSKVSGKGLYDSPRQKSGQVKKGSREHPSHKV